LNLPFAWLYCSSYAENEITQWRKEEGPKDRLWQDCYETWAQKSSAPTEEQTPKES